MLKYAAVVLKQTKKPYHTKENRTTNSTPLHEQNWHYEVLWMNVLMKF